MKHEAYEKMFNHDNSVRLNLSYETILSMRKEDINNLLEIASSEPGTIMKFGNGNYHKIHTADIQRAQSSVVSICEQYNIKL